MKCIHNNYKGGGDNGKEEMLSNVSLCVISFRTKINCAIKINGSIYKQNYPIQLCFVIQNTRKIING